MPSTRVTETDFTVGLFTGLALHGVCTLQGFSTRKFSEVLTSLSSDIQELAGHFNLDLRFRLTPDAHGLSDTASELPNTAVMLRVITLDAPWFDVARLSVKKEDAEDRLKQLAGGVEFYKLVAQMFLNAY